IVFRPGNPARKDDEADDTDAHPPLTAGTDGRHDVHEVTVSRTNAIPTSKLETAVESLCPPRSQACGSIVAVQPLISREDGLAEAPCLAQPVSLGGLVEREHKVHVRAQLTG